ncbi:hypothetical protein ABB37_04267 [Leptomonas pyrrhocoris]|uniref:Leucine-rich repeat protein n=1 Tax=Leptomonas pyrrhocoris TaxID=157538 RepID=A0A0N0VFD3_LEPPY|nr:hypothetical protein ABB37_04267 [Leptomonas pyrrhocoris]KPA80844.1 hypothetical protein ABB37_04267 [Leptomonas pyrrhocoris]|eukprot:XP_015659283.1 hypothetical protein ABB37_04267 [Leptomonas pyrrhocoris]
MGQYQSTPTFKAGAQPQSERCLESFRAAQLDQLRAQLAHLADALALIEASHADGNDSTCECSSPANRSISTQATCPPSSVSTTAFLLQPFAQVHLAGYKLGDDALTQPFQLSLEQPPASALAFLGRDTALSVLDLSYNNLTSTVVEPLLRAVAELPMLTVLRLSGNALGSAVKLPGAASPTEPKEEPNNDDDDTLCLVGGASSDEAWAASPTPAAQLGRWLATNPPLRELFLHQCEFRDHDVHAVLRGLIPHPDSTTSSSLTTLQLAGNPACTWRSARMVLQLVRNLGNTTLRAVELEGAPADTAVRFEYACAADGHFRSGKTLIAQVDGGEGEAAVGATDAAAAAVVVSETTLHELTPGQSARFRSRRRHLREELDGTHVMLPALIHEIDAILSVRRAAAATEAAAAAAAEVIVKDALVEAAPQELQPPTDAAVEMENGGDGGSLREVAVDAAAEDADAHAADDSPHTVAEDGDDGDRDAFLPNAAAEAAMEKPPFSPPTRPPRFLTCSHMRKSLQVRREARFETPQRIARVMAEAEAFRHRIHPLQVDTRAPPCVDVHARSTSSQFGSESAAAPWYAKEGFVMRSNGLSNVLVAPVLSGAASARRNVLLEEMEDAPLQACWCTPRNATSAANYAGILHYHCVLEGEAVRHRGGTATTASTRKGQSQKKDGASKATGVTGAGATGAGSMQLPPLVSAESPAAGAGAAAAAAAVGVESPIIDGGVRTYLGCCGTGHVCLSASASAMRGPQRAQRMRTMLLTQSAKRLPSSSSSSAAAVRPATSHGGGGGVTGRLGSLRRAPPRARVSSAPSLSLKTDDDDDDGLPCKASDMFSGAKTVHQTTNGLAVALNYSPVAFFAAPHVACAAGIQMEECT